VNTGGGVGKIRVIGKIGVFVLIAFPRLRQDEIGDHKIGRYDDEGDAITFPQPGYPALIVEFGRGHRSLLMGDG